VLITLADLPAPPTFLAVPASLSAILSAVLIPTAPPVLEDEDDLAEARQADILHGQIGRRFQALCLERGYRVVRDHERVAYRVPA
jgi:hypothetical protein